MTSCRVPVGLWKISPFQKRLEAAAYEVRRVQRLTQRVDEHECITVYLVALVPHAVPMAYERVRCLDGQCYASAASVGLWRVESVAAVTVDQGALYVHNPAVEVQVSSH